jgi:hypothetical protein
MAATDPADDLAVTPEQVVAHETRTRPRAGAIALAAALFTVAATFVQNTALSDIPGVNEIDALRDVAHEPLGRAGLRTEKILYLHDHAAGVLIPAVLQALAYVGIGLVLFQLLRMTLDRGGQAPRPTKVALYAGTILGSLGALVQGIGQVKNAADFASSSDHGTQAAHDVLTSGSLLLGGTLVGELGVLGITAGTILVALAAMRVGLLPRFVGVLGALVGALQLFGPVFGGSFIVTAFWLVMIGMLMLGRWPSGMPPAWSAGESVPWPSQQEIREERERQRGERGRGGAPATVTGPAGEPSPSASARKKRKRRG